VRQVEDLARKLNESSATSAPIEDEEYPDSYAQLVDEFERILTENISIKRTKSGGCRITIECATEGDVEQLIERLKRIK
jgi:ParB family chromosome partitioning protein